MCVLNQIKPVIGSIALHNDATGRVAVVSFCNDLGGCCGGLGGGGGGAHAFVDNDFHVAIEGILVAATVFPLLILLLPCWRCTG